VGSKEEKVDLKVFEGASITFQESKKKENKSGGGRGPRSARRRLAENKMPSVKSYNKVKGKSLHQDLRALRKRRGYWNLGGGKKSIVLTKKKREYLKYIWGLGKGEKIYPIGRGGKTIGFKTSDRVGKRTRWAESRLPHEEGEISYRGKGTRRQLEE